MAETWRVVLRDGSVREVLVAERAAGWTAHCEGRETFAHAAPTLAVWAFVRGFLGAGFAVREILAPGEPTRAEALAAERERCAKACDEVADEAQREADGAHGDSLAREWFKGRRSGARESAKKIRAGGV